MDSPILSSLHCDYCKQACRSPRSYVASFPRFLVAFNFTLRSATVCLSFINSPYCSVMRPDNCSTYSVSFFLTATLSSVRLSSAIHLSHADSFSAKCRVNSSTLFFLAPFSTHSVRTSSGPFFNEQIFLQRRQHAIQHSLWAYPAKSHTTH